MIRSVLEDKNSHIHFIGIGGVSMSSLAKLLLADGHKISGSDIGLSKNVKELIDMGAEVSIGHKSENVKNPQMIVYTAAVKKDNPELISGEEKNILTIERCDLLGEIMRGYNFPINICGTHGKTTTTSMMASVFLEGNKEPTISIGGDFDKIGGNLNIGKKDYFICEACEYVESFLKFYPYASVILNIEEDHLDYFKDINHIKSSFLKFANLTDKDGFVILNCEDKECMEIADDIKVKVYTFGLSGNADCYAKDIEYIDGKPKFSVYYKDKFMGEIQLGVYGEHNVLNSLSVILTALLFNIDFLSIKKGLENFNGAKRRFEYKGTFKGAYIYDDYAHHPTEIETTIKSAKKKEYNNLYIIFQPHTYTRTKALFDDFVNILKTSDNVIIADIYAAREVNTLNISSKDLADKIPNALYLSTFAEIEDYLLNVIKPNDLILTVGAGDVYKIGENLLNKKI